MKTTVARESGLEAFGLKPSRAVYWNLSVPALYEEAVRRGEGLIAASGPLVCPTVPHTGRSPNDKFIVREPSSENEIWWGKVNREIPESSFEALLQLVTRHLGQVDLFIRDCYAGADPAYRLPIRVITEKAWHSLFARHLFISERDRQALVGFSPEFTIISAPEVHANPALHGTASETFIVINFRRRIVLIGGTNYAGEIKKSVFTLLNYLLPAQQVMPMHCSANIGAERDTALFFGLSGTGKTTLSSDPARRLIGDDEHGWSERGIFNFEGGCYAKVIRLSREAEPQIYQTTERFGTVLENVAIDPDSRVLDLNDDSVTENTRGAYPIAFIDNAELSGRGSHPQNLFMLTADAFGVLPPIARLSSAQAMYHFLSGYTAKVAGTERGVTDPKATFSTCFGAPFLPRPPNVYARFLGEKIAKHRTKAWLLNTGWTGGAFGVGTRIRIAHTRAMIHGALSGALDKVSYRRHEVFGLSMPTACPGIPADVLDPRRTWSDTAAYNAQARKLAAMFIENFKAFERDVAEDVNRAGPKS